MSHSCAEKSVCCPSNIPHFIWTGSCLRTCLELICDRKEPVTWNIDPLTFLLCWYLSLAHRDVTLIHKICRSQTWSSLTPHNGFSFGSIWSNFSLAVWLPLNTSQLLYLIIKMIWQPPDRLVFLGQSQIDNLFQLSLRPAWHHSIRPSVISHPLPRALFHPLLPSGATSVRPSVPDNKQKTTPGSCVLVLLSHPETKRWAETTTLLNVTPGRPARGEPSKMKSLSGR